MKKITLNVDGREMTFSEHELASIIKEHLSIKTSKPIEGKWFEVNPASITPILFADERRDTNQEETRQLILEAFEEMSKHPEKYARNFRTMIAEEEWSLDTVADLKEHACKLGDHNADWVEQALEWAQRIQNGETWESLCNNPDNTNWYRLVVWKNGETRLIGGSICHSNDSPATDIDDVDFYDYDFMFNTVPLVVSYEE